MKIRKNTLVRIHYRLWLDNGDEVDSTRDDGPLTFICGRGDLVPGLERALSGMRAGESKRFILAPENAYGARDPSLIKELPRAGFPSDRKLEKGQCFCYRSDKGAELRYRVAAVKDHTIIADFNHPLAGQRLHCTVEVIEVVEEALD